LFNNNPDFGVIFLNMLNIYVHLILQKASSYTKVYNVVARIPRSKVATYGQIAILAGLGSQARLVGYALNKIPENSKLPWHRVVNREGKISYSPRRQEYNQLQRDLLEAEGVQFDKDNRITMNIFQWIE
jgi:methylated-DNA-protein-cysteine methyltransferase-like protein